MQAIIPKPKTSLIFYGILYTITTNLTMLYGVGTGTLAFIVHTVATNLGYAILSTPWLISVGLTCALALGLSSAIQGVAIVKYTLWLKNLIVDHIPPAKGYEWTVQPIQIADYSPIIFLLIALIGAGWTALYLSYIDQLPSVLTWIITTLTEWLPSAPQPTP